MTEAMMRIMARDSDKEVGTYAAAEFVYVPIYVEERGFLDLDLLLEPFKKIYEDFRDGPPTKKPLERLQRAVGIPVHESYYR